LFLFFQLFEHRVLGCSLHPVREGKRSLFRRAEAVIFIARINEAFLPAQVHAECIGLFGSWRNSFKLLTH
jgi:hypothetical protein